MNLVARVLNKEAKRGKPKLILEKLGLKPFQKVADIGAGGGYFAFQFAKEVEKVYTLDVRQSFLDYINEKIKKEGIDNIETILIKDKVLLPEKVDLIFLRNVYHHLKVENRIEYLRKLKEYLKKEGKLVIVEYEKAKILIHGTQKRTILDELEKAGYRIVKECNILPKQNFLIFESEEEI